MRRRTVHFSWMIITIASLTALVNSFTVNQTPATNTVVNNIRTSPQLDATQSNINDRDSTITRRRLLQVITIGAATSHTWPTLADSEVPQSEEMISTKKIADLLRSVPTFTLVDKKGVPYMVVSDYVFINKSIMDFLLCSVSR
jgi:hypothetical protein